jgi:hypothetical protein
MYRALLLALVLPAATAFAEDWADEYGDVPAAPAELRHVERMSLQTGWRLSANEPFYRGYYADNPGLARAPGSPGGPLLLGSFGYSFTNFFELGLDVAATGERLHLTGQPPLTTMTFAAMVGLRFQKLLPGIGPQGLVPFVGVLAGPTFVMTHFDGAPQYQEAIPTMFGLTAGATLRLTPRWGLTVEYRHTFAHAWPGLLRQADLHLQDFGNVNVGGSWPSVGIAYWWPAKKGPADDRFDW